MDVIMPQLGETVTEGTLTIWHKTEGETVEANELLFEIGTDKVEMEVPAPTGGTIVEIRVKAGETVKVGTILAIIDAAGGEQIESEIDPHLSTSESGSHNVQLMREEKDPSLHSHSSSLTQSGSNRLSPVVRKMLTENNLKPDDVEGTGRDGRIKKTDVLEHLNKVGSDSDSIDVHDHFKANNTSVDGREVIPFNRMRRVTAEHMVRSKTISPHVHQGMEVDFFQVERARNNKGVDFKRQEGFSLSYLPFIVAAVCEAIGKFPKVNAHVEGENLVVFDHVNVAIAVDLDFEGLVVPVIKDASKKNVSELSRTISELANRAKAKTLTPEDYQGATYTISNNGSFGTLFTTPIINQPQVAILSTDAITNRPLAVEREGENHLVIRPVGILTQAFDHRAIDGAYAAAFLHRVKEIIETKDWDLTLV